MHGGKKVAKFNQQGFTIVELLIVVVVIGILAAIVIVAYNGITTQATWTKIQSNLKSIDKSLAIYHAQNGSYPVSSSTWVYSCETGITNFIPELSSITPSLPQAPCENASNHSDTWVYSSNGTDYKIIHIRPNPSIADQVPANLQDTRYSSSQPTWGYWSPGAATW
jgi:prepilin-type N-terminal cleavage/methylation domain-containing protein